MPSIPTPTSDIELDIFIPGHRQVAIEYDGLAFHTERQQKEEEKNRTVQRGRRPPDPDKGKRPEVLWRLRHHLDPKATRRLRNLMPQLRPYSHLLGMDMHADTARDQSGYT
jgi:hypothetical protein